MLESLKFAVKLVGEAIRKQNLSVLFRQQVFYKRAAVPVVIDLSIVIFSKDPLLGLDCRFIEFMRGDVESGKWTFLVGNRKFAALRHISRGLRGFALVNADDVVIGDIWCQTPNNNNGTHITHPDLKMLNITCSEGDAYALDMLIPTDYRGKKLALPLHRSMQLALRKKAGKNCMLTIGKITCHPNGCTGC